MVGDITANEYSSNVLIEQVTGAGTSAHASRTFAIDPNSLRPAWSVDGDGNVTIDAFQTYSGTGGTPISSNNVITTTDAVGNITQAAYNAYNQAWCTVDAADYAHSKTCPSTVPSAPPAPGVTDPNLGVTINFYNSSDQFTATTDALGNTTTYSYTSGVSGVPNGLVYCSVDPVDYQNSVTCPAYTATHVTGTTTETYDSAGDKTSETNPVGDITSYVYSAPGLPGAVSSMTDPDGTITSYTYNGAGQVTVQSVAMGSSSAISISVYDSAGHAFCSADAANVAAYLVAHSGATYPYMCPSSPPSPPTPASDPYLGATITSYDNNGQVVQMTNPLGGITLDAYDANGNQYCQVDPFEAALSVTCPSSPPSSPPTVGSDSYLGATITTFDADNRAIQVTNADGGITLNSYDSAGNITETTVESNNATCSVLQMAFSEVAQKSLNFGQFVWEFSDFQKTFKIKVKVIEPPNKIC